MTVRAAAQPATGGPMGDARCRTVSPAELSARIDHVLALSAAAFAAPPWCESDHEAQHALLLHHLDQRGLEAVVPEHAATFGVAYGWPAPERLPDDPLHGLLTRAAGPDTVVRQLTRPGALVVAEVMVHPARQQRGWGRRLLDHLRDGRPGWLLTHPEAPANHLYRSAGWLAGARFTTPAGKPRVLYTHDGG